MKFYLVILLFALVIPVSQAYSLSAVSIIPSDSLAPGTPVTASFQIIIPHSEFSTFPEGNTLQLVTDLDNVNWSWWVNLNGIGNPHPVTHDRILQMTSWELTYSNNTVRESVRILLEGNAPQVTATQNKIIFDILELDSNFKMISGSETQHTSLVINPSDIRDGAASLTGDLNSFRTKINNKSAMGVDTSKAENKYQEAQQAITAAQGLSSSLYLNAMKYLTNAKESIVIGLKNLDEADAQKAVKDAQFTSYSTDLIIADLKINQSMVNDTRLVALLDERAIATKLIQNATDSISSGDYEQARITAIKASEQWNRTFQDAAILKYSVDNTKYIRVIIWIIVIFVFMAVGAISVAKYTKGKRKEKELREQKERE